MSTSAATTTSDSNFNCEADVMRTFVTALDKCDFATCKELIRHQLFNVHYEYEEQRIIHWAARRANRALLDQLEPLGLLDDLDEIIFPKYHMTLNVVEVAAARNNVEALDFFLEKGGNDLLSTWAKERILTNKKLHMVDVVMKHVAPELFLDGVTSTKDNNRSITYIKLKYQGICQPEMLTKFAATLRYDEELMKLFTEVCAKNQLSINLNRKELSDLPLYHSREGYVDWLMQLPFTSETLQSLLFVAVERCSWDTNALDIFVKYHPKLIMTARDSDGKSALHERPSSIQEISNIMHKYGLDITKLVNHQDKNGNTAHHLLAETWLGRLEAHETFMSLGSDITLKNVNGDTVFHIMFKSNNFIGLKAVTANFIKHLSLIHELTNSEGDPPIRYLKFGLWKKGAEATKFLISAVGATKLLELSLTRAKAFYDMSDVMLELIESGASTDILRDPQVFERALFDYPPSVTKIMLKNGAKLPENISYIFTYEESPFDELERLELLLTYYDVLDIHHAANMIYFGQRVVKKASDSRRVKVMGDMMSKTVDVNLTMVKDVSTNSFTTLLELAVDKLDDAAVRLILQHKSFNRLKNDRYNDAMLYAVKNGNLPIVNQLQDKVAPMTKSQQQEAAMYLVNENKLEMIGLCYCAELIDLQLLHQAVTSCHKSNPQRVLQLIKTNHAAMSLIPFYDNQELRQIGLSAEDLTPLLSKAIKPDRKTSHPNSWKLVTGLLEAGAKVKPRAFTDSYSLMDVPPKVLEQLLLYSQLSHLPSDARNTWRMDALHWEVFFRYLPTECCEAVMQSRSLTQLISTFKKGTHSNLQHHKLKLMYDLVIVFCK